MSTAALAADALAGRRATEAAPLPATRRRIHGATTEPLPVRACSGESLGRLSGTTTTVRRHAPQTRRRPQVEPSALRLTRRGRMLLTVVSVLIFGSAVAVLGLRVAGVLQPGPDFSQTVPVQVAPGQSLWSIAEQTNPNQDPATVVEKIADVNKLSGPADITPGQTLQIPIAR
jgi:nucleoid-associated protein YgaU